MPHQLGALLRQGRRLVARGRPAAARRAFDRALSLDPGCAFALFHRAQLRLAAGDAAGAAADFSLLRGVPPERLLDHGELDTLPPERFPGLLPAARRLARHGRPWAGVLASFLLRAGMRNEEALAEIERAAGAGPGDPALQALLGRVRIILRRVPEGVEALKAAARARPRCGWLRAWLGEGLRRLGRLRAAAAALDRAVALEPGYGLAYAWRGAVRLSLGRARGARADLDRAIEDLRASSRGEDGFVDYTLGWALYQRSLARRALRDAQGALEDVTEAHALNPRHQWVPAVERGPGAVRKALGELDGLVRGAKPPPLALAWRGLTLLEAGRAREALGDLDRAVAAGAGAWARVWRGRARMALGAAREALADFSAAARADRRCAPAHAWRGGALRVLGRFEEAARSLDRAVVLDPVSAWARAWRGEIRLRQGRARAALADFEAALAIHPDYADARAWRAETLRLLRMM